MLLQQPGQQNPFCNIQTVMGNQNQGKGNTKPKTNNTSNTSNGGEVVGLNRQRRPPNMPESYRLDEPIGEGFYAKVYHCGQFAIKRIDFTKCSELEIDMLNKQVQYLSELNHHNIVKLYQSFTQGKCLFMVLQYCESDLQKQLRRISGAKLEEKNSISILQQILSGYSQLRKKGIVHKDIKPGNILIKKQSALTNSMEEICGIVKIADFGFAQKIQNFQNGQMNISAGSSVFMSPQILDRNCPFYTSKTDIWSLGILLHYMLFGTTPWQGEAEQQILSNIYSKKLFESSQPSVSKRTKHLLYRMLEVDDKRRIGWQQLIDEVNSIMSGNLMQKVIDLQSSLQLKPDQLPFAQQQQQPFSLDNIPKEVQQLAKMILRYNQKLRPNLSNSATQPNNQAQKQVEQTKSRKNGKINVTSRKFCW